MTLFENNILSQLIHFFHSTNNAFCINNTYYTYRQLAERISAIRKTLTELRIQEQIVGLAIHDDIDTYATIFALWMEGKAYVPLNPLQPIDRNTVIINQIGCGFIADSSKQSVFENSKVSIIHTGQCSYTTDFNSNPTPVNDDAIAYVLFTSGSTGEPKGVTLSRRNIAAFMDSFWATGIVIDPNDHCLQAFDLTFDVSIQSFLVPLTRGACCYTVPYGQVKYIYIASLIHEKHITFGAMTPSMLTYLHPYFDELDASSLKTCILTAEACPKDLVEDFAKCAINAEIYNFYGPTESTIYCTCYKIVSGGDNPLLNGIISIGKPLSNVQAMIIREDGSLVDGQEKGELCIAGDQLTQGYWDNPPMNATAFFWKENKRYYHTGDLCYWDKSGNILYAGRIDQQVKIQGFRIELGEIEHYARQYFHNQHRVVAIAFQNIQRLTEIALFIESTEGDPRPLNEYLRKRLPYYMIPTRIVFEQAFPLNKGEKIDRNSLKLKIHDAQ